MSDFFMTLGSCVQVRAEVGTGTKDMDEEPDSFWQVVQWQLPQSMGATEEV